MHKLTEPVVIRVTTVPEIPAKFGCDRIDLLNYDIEGSEVDLLGRNHPWLEQVGEFVLEIHPNTGRTILVAIGAVRLPPATDMFRHEASLRRRRRGHLVREP